MTKNKAITIETTVDAIIEKIWKYWTEPEHIKQWNNASDDWHTTKAENDLRIDGRFNSRMEAKDGSFGFDFGGIYDNVQTNKLISYKLDDGRQVVITFSPEGDSTKITEIFEPEDQNSIERQKTGWQAILDNFKKYAENG